MKTNVPIELTDEERSNIYQSLNGPSKKLLTRKDVVALAQSFFAGLSALDNRHAARDTAPSNARQNFTDKQINDPLVQKLLRKMDKKYDRDSYLNGLLKARFGKMN